MSDDPLEALVARSVGGAVSGVRAEDLPPEGAAERKRLRFVRDGQETTAIFERNAPGVLVEAQLLPFLARKTDRVPRVHSRGLPPPHASLGPWLLLEDVQDRPSACDDDALAVVRAKLAIERAVAGDVPALRALGVPSLTPGELVARVAPRFTDERRVIAAAVAAERLAGWPLALAHGDLRCSRARATDRGAVLVGWAHAHLGCALLDAARLAADLRAHGRSPDAATALYVDESGGPQESDWLRDAETVDALLREAASLYN